MGLREDAFRIIEDALGTAVAKQMKVFDDPDKYPEDFLEQCVFFLGTLIGETNAKRKFDPLYRKYSKRRK